MELGLSLGDASKPSTYAEKPRLQRVSSKDLGFCMGLSIGSATVTGEREPGEEEEEEEDYENGEDEDSPIVSIDGPVQLHLLPRSPVPRIHSGASEDVNRKPSTEAVDGDASPPYEADRASCRASDDDENGCSRKKLRLSKEQSAFLEESFKEHSTLNPKQKLAVANQLNLRPRQVEVWFQNRRARTKLKQTEMDCEKMKKSCETLTLENKRLHKELQELRALKINNSLYMQSPATTLNMCPSCKRVATSAAAVSTAVGSNPCSEPITKAPSGPYSYCGKKPLKT